MGISYNTYKKWAKLYGIFEDLVKDPSLNNDDKLFYRLLKDSIWTERDKGLGKMDDDWHRIARIHCAENAYPKFRKGTSGTFSLTIRGRTPRTILPITFYANGNVRDNAVKFAKELMDEGDSIQPERRIDNSFIVRDLSNCYPDQFRELNVEKYIDDTIPIFKEFIDKFFTGGSSGGSDLDYERLKQYSISDKDFEEAVR